MRRLSWALVNALPFASLLALRGREEPFRSAGVPAIAFIALIVGVAILQGWVVGSRQWVFLTAAGLIAGLACASGVLAIADMRGAEHVGVVVAT